MKIRKIVITLAILIIICLGGYLLFSMDRAEYIQDVSAEEVDKAYELLSGFLSSSEFMYTDYLKSLTEDYGTGSSEAEPQDGVNIETYNDGKLNIQPYDGLVIKLDYKDTATYIINVEKTGIYYLAIDYLPMGDSLSNYNVSVMINSKTQYYEQNAIALPLYWKDSSDTILTDSYGDEIAPRQTRSNKWRNTYFYNNTYSSAKPLYVTLKAGENKIEITNTSNDGLGLGKLYAQAPDNSTPDYATYLSEHPDSKLVTDLISINAIDYTEKNSAQIIYSSVNDPSLTPQDPVYKKLNVLSWTKAGDEIEYSFNVKQDGYYNLAFHYKNDKQEFNSYHTILIDNRLPFQELMCYPFAPTDSSWANEILSDDSGKPYMIYLTAGNHTITFKTEIEPVYEAWRYARLISEHIIQFSLEITKLTGTDADKNRTWKMTKYIPKIAEYLNAYEVLIQHIRYLLQDETENGINGALLSGLDKADALIDNMKKYPDEISLHINDLTGRDNSVLVYISTFMTDISKCNFSLDMIYIYGNEKIPDAKAGIWTSFTNGIATLLSSFTSSKYDVSNDDDKVLTVWVNRALTHVDLLQKMVDTEFTEETGIKVKVSAMPDANKLTLAAAANKTPDVALGLASYMPFDLACRGALYDMTQFDDFWKVANRFVAGEFVPYVYNEGVYAIPETQDFNAIIYRKDILDSLGLKPPETWQDVIEMLPELQRYGMNFYHNISSGVGYKWFYQTTPLILQNGGSLYSEDGLSTAINSPDSVKGLKELGDLFIKYSLDTQVNEFFNSFRYSVLPIGIVDSNTYTLIKNGAPELDGQWKLSAYPGTVLEDGTISRWYVANGTGGVIFNATKKADEAWKFLKWWTSHDVQVEYTYTLQSTYGDTYFWLPSNLDAMEDAPIDQEDKKVILDMVPWTRDVIRTPGQYLVERSISDIWNTMVFDGTSAQVAADEKVIDINREIRKKMTELGYYDEDGNLLKKYVVRDIDWIQEQMNNAGNEE